MKRRHLLLGLGAALAAPAIIRTPGLLMPVRRIESGETFDEWLCRRFLEKAFRDSELYVALHIANPSYIYSLDCETPGYLRQPVPLRSPFAFRIAPVSPVWGMSAPTSPT